MLGAMMMPKPTEQHAKLKDWSGTWIGEETMHPSQWDPKGSTATGRIVSRVDIDGMFLISDYTQERDGAINFRGHGVYGWDPVGQCFTMYWFDSIGNDPGGPARGRWEGDTLMFEKSGERGRSRYIYEFEGRDAYRFRIEMSPDGERWTTWLESRWRRGNG
jgi:hypothetical protein